MSLYLTIDLCSFIFAHKNNDNSLSAELGSSYTKDDSVNFQLPGFYFRNDKQGNRSACGTCNCLRFFPLRGLRDEGEVVRHTLLVKVIEERST